MSRTGNVQVAFRVRPLTKEEQIEERYSCLHLNRERDRVSVRNSDGTHHFTFDRVFDESERQSAIYKESVAPLVNDFIAGRNCCVMAYGEEGSGKTHTMIGPLAFTSLDGLEADDEEEDRADDLSSLGSAGVSRHQGNPGMSAQSTVLPPEQILARRGVKHPSAARNGDGSGDRLGKDSDHSKMTEAGGNTSTPMHVITEDSGIMPRVIKDIFDVFRRRRKKNASSEADDPKMSFSFVEVYNERIIDLLDLECTDHTDDDDHSLSIRSNPDQGVYIEDAIDVRCRSESDVSAAVEVALTTRERRLATNDTHDSRAHAVLIMKLERYSKSRGKRATSNFFICDLANSALVRRPPADAPSRVVKEYKSVKKSLGALRKCVRSLALTQRSPTAPFGESALTKLLHNSLVRGSAISLIVTANPMSLDVQESMSAIRYGTYVAGQPNEETEEAPRSPSAGARRRTAAEQRMPPSISENDFQNDSSGRGDDRIKENSQHTKHSLNVPQNQISPIIANGGPSYDELEAAGQLLRKLPETRSHDETSSSSGRSSASRNELNHVSSLLDTAAKKMEADLTDAKRELDNSGFDQALSAEEMELQLLAVTKELETMKYDGHLAVQIQNDLLAAQEELKRLSVTEEISSTPLPVPPQTRGIGRQKSLDAHFLKGAVGEITPTRSGNGAGPEEDRSQSLPGHQRMNGHHRHSIVSTEGEKLCLELELMKKTNERLEREQAAKHQELATALLKIEELKAANEAKTREVEESTTPAFVENDTSRSDVSSNVGTDRKLATVEKKTDEWDEKQIEVGAAPVCVCLRLRPMTKLERNRRSKSCIEVHEGGREFTVDSPLDGEYDFCFDHVFDVDSNQEDVYETVGAPIVDQLLGGVNCAVMVYGLTGSGKSHTLAGRLPEMRDESDCESSDEESVGTERTPTQQDAGFSPRLVADLFRGMKDSPNEVEFRITCSYVCIYLEKIFDLLDPRFDKTLVIRDTTGGIGIEGAVEAFCFDEEDIIHLIRRGAACRKLIGNKLTMDHNRSHSILILNIEQHHIRSGRVRRSYLKLVELAGFEVTTKAKGQSMQETKIIHKSFSALGNVIKSLTEGNPYAPYRESKLTSILKEALGGNCMTTLFITASPSSYHISETINSIRLGQRVRRVTNKPRVNIDANKEDYRTWLLQSETKLGELTSHVQALAEELVKASEEDESIKNSFTSSLWESILAIANEEESMSNPCREALLMDEDEFLEPGQQKWRALTIELARRLPSEKLEEIRKERNRAQSLLSDIQSESVVLRRQNDLLIQEKRKKEEELAHAYRENRKMTLQHAEVDHKLQLAENRARDTIIFLRYMRTLCWKLRKDVERDRPVDITEITSHLHGAPDLSGLVDLDTMMLEGGFIYNKEVEIEKVETEYFNYLQDTGLIIDEEQVAAEEEVDELAFLDDGLGSVISDNRWRKAQTRGARVDWVPGGSTVGSTEDTSKTSSQHDTFLGLTLPWMGAKKEETEPRTTERADLLGVRNTRKERELQRDLQNMANKCVELQMELNEQRQLMDALTNKATTLKMKRLTQEALTLAKERDRMMHNAKAATWKLQELHVVNKLLSKQAAEAKQQIRFLEEGFQRLQESFRGTVQEGLDTDLALRDRVKALQSIVDSLTGPPGKVGDDSDEESDDDDSLGSANPLLARINLPLRGRAKPAHRPGSGLITLVDPSGPDSKARCLWLQHTGKRPKKLPSLFGHHKSKFIRKSLKFGTALIGENREKLQLAYKRGLTLSPPLFLEDDASEYSEEDDYYEE